MIKLKLTNFRRFAGRQSLDLNEDLIALVGPNEAGKSSILAAIETVGRGVAPGATDTTRGLDDPAEVSALFALDSEDREVLAGIHGGDAVTRLWVTRRIGGGSTWGSEPFPHRDLRPRRECLALLEAIDGDGALDPAYSTGEEQWNSQFYLDVKTAIASTEDELTAETISSLETLAQRIRAIRYPPDSDAQGDDETEVQSTPEDTARAEAREAAAFALLGLATVERLPQPWRQVMEALSGRLPEVAFFSEADRELQSTYQLADVAADAPPALRNLCALANLDLGEVQASLTSGRTGHAESLFEVANRLLKERFQQTWHQSTVYPRLSTPLDGVLRVFVATEGGDYTFPEERSDGLLWFMALHAFLSTRGQRQPILLVDEAETHLHYDAQADLIDALMNQRIARQVVYTTHSVGCLPPDLGCGIRVMLAETGAERSRIANSYWSVDPGGDDKVGYTPLLFAMGARLLALTIPRFGAIVEGPSDAILMPSLLREATGLRILPYRIAPGLSEVAQSDVATLSYHAGKVVAIADGDAGGLSICEKLRDGGVPPASVFNLGAVRSACTLEDIVDGAVLAEAINRELETWGIESYRVGIAELPGTGRWAWLVGKGNETGTPIDRLSKLRVAQRVVDIGRQARDSGSPRALVNAADIDGIRALHKSICADLGLPTAED
jgi:AAA domain/AAA domain, putative AbiEii toxin, Type IV TA system